MNYIDNSFFEIAWAGDYPRLLHYMNIGQRMDFKFAKGVINISNISRIGAINMQICLPKGAINYSMLLEGVFYERTNKKSNKGILPKIA